MPVPMSPLPSAKGDRVISNVRCRVYKVPTDETERPGCSSGPIRRWS
jgi:hypothetical protein